MRSKTRAALASAPWNSAKIPEISLKGLVPRTKAISSTRCFIPKQHKESIFVLFVRCPEGRNFELCVRVGTDIYKNIYR